MINGECVIEIKTFVIGYSHYTYKKLDTQRAYAPYAFNKYIKMIQKYKFFLVVSDSNYLITNK